MSVQQPLRAPFIPAPREPARRPTRLARASSPARGRRREVALLLLAVAVVDVVLICVACALAWELRTAVRGLWFDEPRIHAKFWSASAATVVATWAFVLHQRRIWRPRHLAADLEEFRAIGKASVVALGVVVLLDFVLELDLGRAFVLLTFVVGTPLLMLSHFGLRRAVQRLRLNGRLRHRVLVVGSVDALREVEEMLRIRRSLGYDVVGLCTPAELGPPTAEITVPHLGTIDDVRSACRGADADTVLVAGGGLSSATDLRRIGWSLQGSPVRLIVAPSLVDVAGPRVQMSVIAGLPLVHVDEPQAGQAGCRSKRAFDLVSASILLILAAPVLLAAAVAIKATDGGPVFYRQQRIGRDGGAFDCLKLRTMRVGADALEAQLRAEAGHDGALFKLTSDPRITRVGGILRRFSIDELPQLFNVLRGDMSMVGPRPQQAYEVATYDDAAQRRLLVRPGITGLWQVSGRSNLPWQEAVRLDLYYVDNWSMAGDFMIIAKTVRAVLARDGAY